MDGPVVAMIMGALLVISADSVGLEILTPSPQVSVSTNRLHIVGRSSAPAVRVELNGNNVGLEKVIESVVHIHLSYGYGLNEVTLTPIYDDSDDGAGLSETIQIMYGPSVSRKLQRIFEPYRFHDASPKEECVECHGPGGADLADVSDEATCLGCHEEFREKFERHTPASDGICIDCHQMDPNLAEFNTTDPGSSSCYHCHTDKIGQYAQEYIHGPVAGGGCVICHDPHGSPYENNLHSPEQILCFSCHVDLTKELDREFVHKPFGDGQCGGCHDPHSTNNRWVLIKSTEDICMSCHFEQGSLATHEHPYNVAPKRKLPVDLKLTERGTLECLSCHNPHASNTAHLLNVASTFSCIGCHSDKQ